MWDLQTPFLELILRALCVFIFLFAVLRIFGKKHFGQITTFDFILLLIISEAVQNALVGDDKSVSAGFITILTLVLMNVFMDKLTYWSRSAEKFIDGEPQIIIKDGRINFKCLKAENMTLSELGLALREGGVMDASEVKQATLETDGTISIVKKDDVSLFQKLFR